MRIKQSTGNKYDNEEVLCEHDTPDYTEDVRKQQQIEKLKTNLSKEINRQQAYVVGGGEIV